MRALLLAGLVAWLAGAGGQQRHPYTLWTDGDTQVGYNHHTYTKRKTAKWMFPAVSGRSRPASGSASAPLHALG